MTIILTVISTFAMCCVFFIIQFVVYMLFFQSSSNTRSRFRKLRKLIVYIEVLLAIIVSLLAGIMSFSNEQFGSENIIKGMIAFNELKREDIKSVKVSESKNKDSYLSELYLIEGESILSEVIRIIGESYIGDFYTEQAPSSLGELYQVSVKSQQNNGEYLTLCEFTIDRKSDYAIVNINWKSIIRK